MLLTADGQLVASMEADQNQARKGANGSGEATEPYYVSGPMHMPGEDLNPAVGSYQGLEYAGFIPMPQAVRNLLAEAVRRNTDMISIQAPLHPVFACLGNHLLTPLFPAPL